MAYVDGLLSSGERVVLRDRQHWFVMVWNARWAVLAVILAVVGGVIRLLNGGDNLLLAILGWIVLILLVAGLVSLVWGWFAYVSTEYVVTNRRLIQTQGILNKKASDSSLEKINDAVLEQGALARVFGYGALDVMTASASGIQKMRFLLTPVEFKKDMMDAKHELEMGVASGRFADVPLRAEPVVSAPVFGSQPSGTEAPVPVPAQPDVAQPPAPVPSTPAEDPTETLAKLADLRDKGAITPEEYEAKKTELLGRI